MKVAARVGVTPLRMGWSRRYHHVLKADRVIRPRTRKATTATTATPRRAGDRLIRRSELASVIDELRHHAHNLDIQFRRIADIQADVDELKRRVKKRNSRG